MQSLHYFQCTHAVSEVNEVTKWRKLAAPTRSSFPITEVRALQVMASNLSLLLQLLSSSLLHVHPLLRNGWSEFQEQQMRQLNLYRAENLLVQKLLCASIAVCRQMEKEPWSLPPIKGDKWSCWHASTAAQDRPAWLCYCLALPTAYFFRKRCV